MSGLLWKGVAFLPLLRSTDLSVCCSGFHVHRRQLLPQAEPRLLHDHHLHSQSDDRHAVLGLLLALRGRRPRQNLTGHLDRSHHDNPDLHGRFLSAQGRALNRVVLAQCRRALSRDLSAHCRALSRVVLAQGKRALSRDLSAHCRALSRVLSAQGRALSRVVLAESRALSRVVLVQGMRALSRDLSAHCRALSRVLPI